MSNFFTNPIQRSLFEHAAGKFTDVQLIELFRKNDFFCSLCKFLNDKEINRLKSSIERKGNMKIVADTIQELCGVHINLVNYEKYLIEIHSEYQKFEIKPIGSIEQIKCFLGGDIIISYNSIDGCKNVIAIFKDIDPNLRPINLLQLNGALYYNHICVPITSTLEQNIIGTLVELSEKKWNPKLSQIVNYLTSNQYVDFAKRIGRIN